MWLIATRLTAGVDSSPRHTLPRDKRHPNRATYDTLAGATVKTTGRTYFVRTNERTFCTRYAYPP